MALSPQNITFNVRIMPFGHAAMTVRTGEGNPRVKESMPVYREPKTTDEGMLEISFNGNNYSIPKTTGGLF